MGDGRAMTGGAARAPHRDRRCQKRWRNGRRTGGGRRQRGPTGATARAVLVAALVAALATVGLVEGSAGTAAGVGRAAAGPSATGAATVRWLCHPGMTHDPCAAPLTATAVHTTGATTIQRARPARHPAIDCFYVYPTVSLQSSVNANWEVQAAERDVAEAQVSRFSSVCRVYAPVYRQLTLYALAHPTRVTSADAHRAYDDVAAAWRSYLAHDNHGRGVVLLGHSQGATVLINLIEREVDDRPSVRRRLVSAILLGGNVTVPVGKNVGGSFRHVPACRSTRQLHCVVAYSSFDRTPPSDANFGVVGQGVSKLAGGKSGPRLEVLCTNPATLAGGSGALSPYFPSHLLSPDFPGSRVKTPWVSYPGMYRSHCEYQHGVSWLQVDDVAPRGDTNPTVHQSAGPAWGLHSVDVNIALGNLVDLVRSESAAYARGA